jgi:hypothetical protein
MRKEKFSYLILLAEVIAIVWLHSTKAPANQEINNTPLARKQPTKATPERTSNYIQTTYPIR